MPSRSLLFVPLFLCLLNPSDGFTYQRSTAFHLRNAAPIIRASRATTNKVFRVSPGYHTERDQRLTKQLVDVTNKLLGDPAVPPGSMDKDTIRVLLGTMQQWAHRTDLPNSKAPKVVQQLFHRLVQEQNSGNVNVRIKTYLYNVVLKSLRRSHEVDAPVKAEAILMAMEHLYANGNKKVRPDLDSFNSVLRTFGNIPDKSEAMKKVEAMLAHMIQLSETDANHSPPNRRTYNLVLYALDRSNLPNAGDRAEQILHHMIAQADNNTRPDVHSYNFVLKILAKGRIRGFETHTQTIFDLIMALPPESHVKPNVDTFNHILACWGKSTRPDALQQMLRLLTLCEETFHNGNTKAKPDSVTVNTVMSRLSRTPLSIQTATQLQFRMELEYQIKPDTCTNNILIYCWSRSRRDEAIEVVTTILTQMESHLRDGTDHSKPNEITYSTVFDMLGKCGRKDAGERCSEILRTMIDLHANHGGIAPSVRNYNVCLNAWALPGTKNGAEKALQILSEMEGNAAVPNPDLRTYNTVLKALRNGNTQYAVVAEEILDRLERHEYLAPDEFTYSLVMSVLGRCHLADKAQRALKMIQRMISRYEEGKGVKPALPCFNAALNACAFHDGGNEESRAQAFACLVEIQKLLLKYARPDHFTYGTILQACSFLLRNEDPRRHDVVVRVFEKARREGLLHHWVLEQLRFAASPELYESLLSAAP